MSHSISYETLPRLLVSRIAVGVGVFLYLLSFLLPVIRIPAIGSNYFLGFQTFYASASALIASLFRSLPYWTWLANPFCWVGFYKFLKRSYGWACTWAVLGCLLTTIPFFRQHQDELMIGYYVWVAGITLIALGVTFEMNRDGRNIDRRGFDIVSVGPPTAGDQ